MMKFNTGPEWDERIVTLKPKRKIGVLMSSGADSTTLFKLLWDNFPTAQIRIFNVQTSEDPSKPTIENILEKLNIDLKIEIVGKHRYDWPMTAHYPRLCLAYKEIRETTDCEELYCGNILSPHPYFFQRFDHTQKGIPKRVWLTQDEFLKCPFEHIEKYHVLDLGIRNGFEWLYNHTISCNIYADKHCGECIGCHELQYGWDQLKNPKTYDLDTMTQEAIDKYGNLGW